MADISKLKLEEGEENVEMSPLQQAKELVDKLYQFRDHYFDNHSIDKAAQRTSQIQAKLKETVDELQKLQDGSSSNRAEWLLQRGRAYNILAGYNPEAQEALAKAVKLEPTMVEAWVHLGECYWKNGDVEAAKNCFTGALSHQEDKVALRNLSMVLRALKGSTEERAKQVKDSVEHAKAAVKLDPTDGTSWLILGNAYLSLFFSGGQSPSIMKQCMRAYQQAEKDKVTSCNPDLHFNRSMMFKYQEEYKASLDGFAQAAALDPTWPEPQEQERRLVAFLDQLQHLISTKGKLRVKKLQALMKGLKDSDLGPYEGGSYTSQGGDTIKLDAVSLDQLKPGLNTSQVILGKVVCSLTQEEPVPFTFCIIDKAGTCVGVTLYNAASGYGVKIGDSVAVPEPYVQPVELEYNDKSYSFRCIRVDSPVVMVVNGRKLGLDKQAPTVLSVCTMSE